MTQKNTLGRKPRIALMGEFSAGKSTLCNFLLGQKTLPEKVTATRVPPIWMTHGDSNPVRVANDGTEEPVSLLDLEHVSIEETRYIRMQFDAPILHTMDLLDLPGISDPNMSSEVWENMVEEVDAILWCTHATQSWRQSEAGAWDLVPEHVRRNSLLLVTKFDRIMQDKDRIRVMKRLQHEAGTQFSGIYPVSLLQALQSERGSEQWIKSGADGVLGALHQITATISEQDATVSVARKADVSEIAERTPQAAKNVDAEPEQSVSNVRVMPRRVKPAGSSKTDRPARVNSGKVILEYPNTVNH